MAVILIALIALAAALLDTTKSKPGNAESQQPPNDPKALREIARKLSRPDLNKLVFTYSWNAVNEFFYDPDFNGRDWAALRDKYKPGALAAKDEAALYTIINDMLNELGASHLTATSPTAMHAIKKTRSNFPSLTGFLTLQLPPDGARVVLEVRPRSPAHKAGIKPGWIALNDPSKNAHIPFQEGHTVQADFLDEYDQPKTVKIKLRNTTTIGSERTAQILPGGILYLNFGHFDDRSAKWVREQLKMHSDTAGVVVDLRQNNGGSIDATCRILGNFFPEPVKVGTFLKRDESNQACDSVHQPGGAHYKGRVAVLVSRFTASGAEVFAATIKHYRRGTIVGWASTGRTKGSVLASGRFELPDGGRISVPGLDFIFVDGTRIEGVGVRTDIDAPMPTVASIRAGKDEAIELGALIAADTEPNTPAP